LTDAGRLIFPLLFSMGYILLVPRHGGELTARFTSGASFLRYISAEDLGATERLK